jgi:hypothetical protein
VPPALSCPRNTVPGLKSWAKFTASLRDEDREPCSHGSLPIVHTPVLFPLFTRFSSHRSHGSLPIVHAVLPIGGISASCDLIPLEQFQEIAGLAGMDEGGKMKLCRRTIFLSA